MDTGGSSEGAWRHIAVAVDSSAESARALQEAVAAARRQHARLTIICVSPRPWSCAGMAGVSPVCLQSDLLQAAADLVRRLADTVPPDLPCTTYARCGWVAGEILQVLRAERADALFIASPRGVLRDVGARWTLRRLTRSAPVAVITVGDGSGVHGRSSEAAGGSVAHAGARGAATAGPALT